MFQLWMKHELHWLCNCNSLFEDILRLTSPLKLFYSNLTANWTPGHIGQHCIAFTFQNIYLLFWDVNILNEITIVPSMNRGQRMQLEYNGMYESKRNLNCPYRRYNLHNKCYIMMNNGNRKNPTQFDEHSFI